jgi:hypothetical protein
VWTPLFPNCLVRIDRTMPLKKEALAQYASQLAEADYLHASVGLNAHRSAGLLDARNGYAEAFHVSSLAEYRELYTRTARRASYALGNHAAAFRSARRRRQGLHARADERDDGRQHSPRDRAAVSAIAIASARIAALDCVSEVLLEGGQIVYWDQVKVPGAVRRLGIDVLFNPKYSIPLNVPLQPPPGSATALTGT